MRHISLLLHLLLFFFFLLLPFHPSFWYCIPNPGIQHYQGMLLCFSSLFSFYVSLLPLHPQRLSYPLLHLIKNTRAVPKKFRLFLYLRMHWRRGKKERVEEMPLLLVLPYILEFQALSRCVPVHVPAKTGTKENSGLRLKTGSKSFCTSRECSNSTLELVSILISFFQPYLALSLSLDNQNKTITLLLCQPEREREFIFSSRWVTHCSDPIRISLLTSCCR